MTTTPTYRNADGKDPTCIDTDIDTDMGTDIDIDIDSGHIGGLAA